MIAFVICTDPLQVYPHPSVASTKYLRVLRFVRSAFLRWPRLVKYVCLTPLNTA